MLPMMPNDILRINNEDARCTKSPLWTEDGKTLSKNLMYAPLVAYQKSAFVTSGLDSSNSSSSTIIHPSQYMSQKKTVPASIRESSLASTLHFVSCDYHSNLATVNDAKNNGSRPLGLSDMDDRIRQRAVTLVGGGINSVIPFAKMAIRSKKRRHRSWEEAEAVLGKFSVEEVILEAESSHAISFLRKLNTAWNNYAWELLTSDKDNNEKRRMSDNDLNGIEVRLGALLSRKNHGGNGGSIKSGGSFNGTNNAKDDYIDLVGAHLKVNSSNTHTSWVGRFGVLIGETKNTYRIASCARNQEKKNNLTKESLQKKKQDQNQTLLHLKLGKTPRLGVEKDTVDFVQGTEKNTQYDTSVDEPRATNIEILVLPKRGSTLQFILPFLFSESKGVDCNVEQGLGSKGVTRETLIAVPDEAMCFFIED